MCVKGECVMGECTEDRYDLDQDPNNGCEYACKPSADPTEVCDSVDNDCDGLVDNGFDLTTDANNCGVCGHVCSLLHGSSTLAKPSAEGPTCVVDVCEDGWHDVDKVDANGCEYQCSKTGLNGVACDAADTACGAERCDAYDNDCNGVINDGNEAAGGPDGGQPCLDYCNGVACKGECTAGVSTCVGKDLVCIPGKGPKQEVCDGKDNDCDGNVDNGFDFTKDPNNCGSCGVSAWIRLRTQLVSARTPPARRHLHARCLPASLATRTSTRTHQAASTNAPSFRPVPRLATAWTTTATASSTTPPRSLVKSRLSTRFATMVVPNGRPVVSTPCATTTVSCGGPAAGPATIRAALASS